ncbi:MAG: deoxyribose-phosphate aldolase [Acidimicrobiia bacterium]|nr:deoxyribose-phosphate aldolase [Acidimicrobiia bacterium]
MTELDRRTLAALIDHTVLDPLATAADVRRLCDEAVEWGIGHVCVSPSRVAVAAQHLVSLGASGAVGVASVVGFPSGAHRIETKAFEAAEAVRDGAAEIDLVVSLGAIADGDWAHVAREVGAVRAAAEAATATAGIALKAILETAAIGSDRLEPAAEAALAGGAGWLKTSTGFHPAGGATVAAVAALRRVAAGRALVKAAGGIRSVADAKAMVDAGAARLGTSGGVALLRSLE